jgi:3-oxoacyl-[acyl-carrier protein] reductase
MTAALPSARTAPRRDAGVAAVPVTTRAVRRGGARTGSSVPAMRPGPAAAAAGPTGDEQDGKGGAVHTTAGLAGKTAVVTGTAHGIGAAIAAALRADGATVHCVDKHAPHADWGDHADLAVVPPGADGPGSPPSGGSSIVDLSDSGAVRDFFAGLGGVDILVNSAGGVAGQTGMPLEEVTDENWNAVVGANLTTAFLCTRAAVPAMKQRGWGRIITISSAAGLGVSKTGIQAYASAKAAQIGFTRQMAHELGPFGITVNCIAPGFILSNPTTQVQWEGYGSQGQAALVAGIATRRLGRPADIANGVRFFAAEQSSWITGQTIAIDGGHAGL